MITPREIRLVREAGKTLIRSYAIRDARDSDQTIEWHDGHVLPDLARRLEEYRRGEEKTAARTKARTQ